MQKQGESWAWGADSVTWQTPGLFHVFMRGERKGRKEGGRVGRKDGHVPRLFCWGFLQIEPQLLSLPTPRLALGRGQRGQSLRLAGWG